MVKGEFRSGLGKARKMHLLLFIGVSLAAGLVGSMASEDALREWYPTLTKPPFTPPSWVFSVVWTLLYILMGIAAWWVWKIRGWKEGRLPLALFFAQLALNVAWPTVFFAMRAPGAAFGLILVLLLAVAVTTVAFFRVSRVAGGLFVPYLAWVAFATLLNYEFWRLNP